MNNVGRLMPGSSVDLPSFCNKISDVIYWTTNKEATVVFTLKNGCISGFVNCSKKTFNLTTSQIQGLNMSFVFSSVKIAQDYLSSFWYTLSFPEESFVFLRAYGRILGGMKKAPSAAEEKTKKDEKTIGEEKIFADLERKGSLLTNCSGIILNKTYQDTGLDKVHFFYRACTEEEAKLWEQNDFAKLKGGGYLSPSLEYASSCLRDKNVLIEIEFICRGPSYDTVYNCYRYLCNVNDWGSKVEDGIRSIEIDPTTNATYFKGINKKLQELGFRELPDESKKPQRERPPLLGLLIERGALTVKVKRIIQCGKFNLNQESK